MSKTNIPDQKNGPEMIKLLQDTADGNVIKIDILQTSDGGETSGCGQTRESNDQNIPAPETTCSHQKHVREYPSDSYGVMTFTGTTLTWAKYVRASCDTTPSILYDLMTKQWGLSAPNLLISVTGGAKNFSISPRLKEQFSRGLVKAAESTGAWIITGGTHAGVMKYVGEAVRDFSWSQPKLVLIGIATWGIIHNRERLVKKEEEPPAAYPMDEGSQGNLCCLDNNHTHFILVDDGTQGQYGVEIKLRTALEKFISKQSMKKEETAINIPIVCVVLGGGPGTLETIDSSMGNKTPCVIVKGSGGVADIIAEMANPSSSKMTDSDIKEKLQNHFQEENDPITKTKNITEHEISMWIEKIKKIVQEKSLLTILQEENVGEYGMDAVILQAVLKASHSTDHGGKEDWEKQLTLAISWNRADIVKKEIFTKDRTWKPSDLYQSLRQSLTEDKPDFVKLFLDHGVSLSEFLTRKTLTDLYNDTDPSTLIHSKLQRPAKVKGSSTINLHHISHVLQELLRRHTEPLYPEEKTSQGKTKPLEHPVRDLLIWCIVQHRSELAETVWNLSRDCVAGALFCTKVLKALANEEEDSEKMEEITALADEYEKRAKDVFSECYSNDKKRAESLLIHESSKWGKSTILELARKSDAKIFMSHGGVQMFLTKTWWGKLSVDNGFLQILLCMLLFPLIYSGLISYRKESENYEFKQKHNMKSDTPENHGCWVKFKDFYNSPIIKFYYNVVSYIIFLGLFAYVLMIDFQTFPSWTEYLLYVWVFSLLCEELRQLFFKEKEHGFTPYISEFWNKVDVVSLCLFALGLICRLGPMETEYLGRVLLSQAFMVFCFRLVHIFTVSKFLGPKIVMIRRMVKDIFFFLFLLVIFIFAYGVANQVILYSNETRLSWIIRDVVYYPYLIVFGQLPPDMDNFNFDPAECTQNGTDPTLPKCVYNDGSGNPLFPGWLTTLLLCLYLLFANILLLNLLIAMINKTIGDVDNQTDHYWKFHRFGLIKEYNERPPFPPPFILLYNLYLVLIVLKDTICNLQTQDYSVLRLKLEKDQESSLLSWESYMKDNYQHTKQQQERQSQEHLVKETADSVAALHQFHKENMGEHHQLEERLSALMENMGKSHQLEERLSALMDMVTTLTDKFKILEKTYTEGRTMDETEETKESCV